MTERITISDASLVLELERWMVAQLQGTVDQPGLYVNIGRGIPKTWDAYQRMVGQVQAYETALTTLWNLRKQGGDFDTGEKVIISRAGIN